MQIGIPREAFLEQRGQPIDDFAIELIKPLVERAALVPAINAAWLLCGVLTVLSAALIFFVRRSIPDHEVIAVH